MPSKRFKIEKVPLSYAPVDHQPVFPSCPILYLELLENKEKVIPALKNKEQDPIFLPNVPTSNINNVHPYTAMDDNKEFFSERDIRAKLNDRMKRSDPNKSYEDRDRKSTRERMDERARDEVRARELSAARKKESRSHPKEYQAYPPLPPEIPSTQEDNVRNILGGTASVAVAAASAAASANLPPTLSQINSHASANAPVQNLSYTDTGDEVKRKRDLLFRFDILKKSYKGATIPDFSEYTDLATMEQVYEDTVRKVGLDSKVEGYKKFLTMGFFGIEFLFSNVFKVDMSGFAKQQLSSMDSYERILIELGEKAMLEKAKSQWPAEIRLLFTIIMNAVIFLLMKNVMSGGLTNIIGSLAGAATGAVSGDNGGGGGGGMGGMGGMMSGLMSMMSGMGGGGGGGGGMAGSSNPVASAAPSKPKGKMKGPSISLEDVEKQKQS